MHRSKRSLYEAFSDIRRDVSLPANGSVRPRRHGAEKNRRSSHPPRLALAVREARRSGGVGAGRLRARSLVWVGGTVLAVSALAVLAHKAREGGASGDLALSARTPPAVGSLAGSQGPVPASGGSQRVAGAGMAVQGAGENAAPIPPGVGVKFALRAGAWAGDDAGERKARDLVAELEREGYPRVQGLVLQESGEFRVYLGQFDSATDPALADLQERVIEFLRESVLADPAEVRIEALPTIVR